MGEKAKAAVTDLGKGSLEPQLEEEAQMDLKPPVKSINSTQPSQARDASATRGPCRALKEISISPKCSPFKREGGGNPARDSSVRLSPSSLLCLSLQQWLAVPRQGS